MGFVLVFVCVYVTVNGGLPLIEHVGLERLMVVATGGCEPPSMSCARIYADVATVYPLQTPCIAALVGAKREGFRIR